MCSSCCFHLHCRPQNFRTSWNLEGFELRSDEMPSNVGTTKCTGLKHWNSRGNTLWINSLNVRPHQFCDRLHFRFVCVKLPLQSTPILLGAEEAYQEESKFLGKWKKINKSAPLLWLGKNILNRRISICMWRILDNFSTASIHNTTNVN